MLSRGLVRGAAAQHPRQLLDHAVALQGLQLVVPDLRAARARLAEQGVDISEVQVYAPEGLRPARDDDELDNVGFAFFSDPDGNRWALQQISSRG